MGSTSPALSEVISSVTDTTPPVVTIISPSAGAAVAGMVTVAATATDNVAVANMSLSIDGSVVASASGGSISYRWNTKKLRSGAHSISAKATDTSGNSATVSETVNR